jgi:hypothetical protein
MTASKEMNRLSAASLFVKLQHGRGPSWCAMSVRHWLSPPFTHGHGTAAASANGDAVSAPCRC